MDSLIPGAFVGRCVASADVMCATSDYYDYFRAHSVQENRIRILQHQYEQRVKEHEALRRKIEHERKIREAQKNPLNRLLRWLKKT